MTAKIDLLVNEILNQLPNDVIINGVIADLSIGGGQFLKEVERRKRAAGKTDDEIKSSVFGFASGSAQLKGVINMNKKNKLVGTYEWDKNILEKDFGDMKFDLIVGNPPYQDTSADRSKFNQLGNKKLYKEFMHKAGELINYDGFISLVVPAAILKTTVYGQPGEAISLMGNNKIVFIDTNVNSYFPGIGISICYFIAKKTNTNMITEIKNFGSYDFNSIGFIAKEFELQSIANKILRKNSNVTIERTANPTAKKGFWTTRFAYLSPSFKKENHELFWGHAEPKKLMRLVESNLFARVAWDGFVIIDKRWYNKFWSALYVHPDIKENMSDDEIMNLYGLTNEEKKIIDRIDRTRVTRKES